MGRRKGKESEERETEKGEGEEKKGVAHPLFLA